MGIENNDGTISGTQSGSGPRTAPAATGSFTASSGPSPTDFLSLSAGLGISRIDATVEPYLIKLMESIKKAMPSAVLKSLTKNTGMYYVEYKSNDGTAVLFGLSFVQLSEITNPDFIPASVRLGWMFQEMGEVYHGQRFNLVDARVMVSGYEPEMTRVEQMADEIVRTIQVTTIPQFRDSTARMIAGSEYVASWNISEARRIVSDMSPHGVPPRMDLALVVKAKIKNNYAGRETRGMESDYRFLGLIAGYVEVLEKSQVPGPNGQMEVRYQPIFHVTVARSIIPLEGVHQILLAALAGKIYNSPGFWSRQWSELGKDKPTPGSLEENPADRGKPLPITNQEELHAFINARFNTPYIALQIQDGRDNIPGVYRLGMKDGNSVGTFVNRVMNFFELNATDAPNFPLVTPVENRYEGVFGNQLGELKDSREIDYFYVANNLGFGAIAQNPDMRRTLLSVSTNPSERAKLVQQVTNSFAPLYLTNVVLVNPDYVKWLIAKTQMVGMTIIDPDSVDDGRPLSSYVSGFGTAAGIGSLVSARIGAGTNWNFTNWRG